MDQGTTQRQSIQATLDQSKDMVQIYHPLKQLQTLRSMPCRDYRHFESMDEAVKEYTRALENAMALAVVYPDDPALMEYQELLAWWIMREAPLPPNPPQECHGHKGHEGGQDAISVQGRAFGRDYQ